MIVSEPRAPRAIITKIISEVRSSPESRVYLVTAYLPLLLSHVAALVNNNRMLLAQFKFYFVRQWQVEFPDIPVPDFEGVYSYDTMIRRFVEHIMVYRDRVYVRLGVHGIRSGVELEQAVKLKLAEILYNTAVGLLEFLGRV